MKLTIFALSLVLIVFSFGCAPSAETTLFANSLTQIDSNLNIVLKNVNTDFANYNANYEPGVLFSRALLTESIVRNMLKKEQEINEDMTDVESILSQYAIFKQPADLAKLTDAQKTVMNQIERKKVGFYDNKEKVDACLASMGTYRALIDLARLNVILIESFATKMDIVNNEIQSGEYESVLVNIELLKHIVREIKKNGEQRSRLGIIQFDVQILSSWDIYIDSLNELQKYIRLVKQEGPTANADLQYQRYSKKYTQALTSSEEESLSTNLNAIDNWYDLRIHACANAFDI